MTYTLKPYPPDKRVVALCKEGEIICVVPPYEAELVIFFRTLWDRIELDDH